MNHNNLFWLYLFAVGEGREKKRRGFKCFQMFSDHWYLSMLKLCPSMN